ncbi:SMI1/KNR4 family protein [Phenylobacterium aquaticum]|uniref:SMI1/KNR4 family protein n=1 Tax=Phenylobacterium aquaticum TaxID=1763816 RepID=UPI001F5C54DA|nr:SMI1/KNR4 family protein [Phenylobacterium aquaticum]MCI3132917.1 SMI1/KNR4 family protein [Phenylobacterium aquaticum]
MKISIHEAARQLEERRLLKRERQDHSSRIVEHVRDLLGRELPPDLVEFYRERIAGIGEFSAITPHWNEHVGWRTPDELITKLLHADAVPLFDDGCGNFYGLDLTSGPEAPAVYFFDHERSYEKPEWAAGSSVGAFLLLLADSDRAYAEGWRPRWELDIDPDIEKCPRAPAIWATG